MKDPNAPDLNNGNAEGVATGYAPPPPGSEIPPGYPFGPQGYYPYYQPYPHPHFNPGYPPPPPPAYHSVPGFNPYAAPPPPYPYGPYGEMPPANGEPPAQGNPQNSFAASMNEMADQNGLGMFKDLFNWDDGDFWKGAMVGAALVMLMTNEELRSSIVNGAAKTAETIKNGFTGEDVTKKAEESEE